MKLLSIVIVFKLISLEQLESGRASDGNFTEGTMVDSSVASSSGIVATIE
jgi:hypothetical protein